MTDRPFIFDAPGGLSERAVRFLRERAERVAFEPGLVRDDLRLRINEVYGAPDERIVLLLDDLQARYGGLSYRSGFFDAVVVYSPVCEPEDPEEELEILYAIQTGSVTGASVKADGSVEIGLDGAGVREFTSLDSVIECDALFYAAESFPFSKKLYVEKADVSRVLAAVGATHRPVPEASGLHSWCLESDSSSAFVCATWAELTGVMGPTIQVWGTTGEKVDEILRHIG